MGIAGRIISSFIQTQEVGNRYRSYLEAARDSVDFDLAYVPASFDAPHREWLDTDFMRALYQTDFDMTAKDYSREKRPPGF